MATPVKHSKIFNDDLFQRLLKDPGSLEVIMVECKDLPFDESKHEINVKDCLTKHGMQIDPDGAFSLPEPIAYCERKLGRKPRTISHSFLGKANLATVNKICDEPWVKHVYGHGPMTGKTSAYL